MCSAPIASSERAAQESELTRDYRSPPEPLPPAKPGEAPRGLAWSLLSSYASLRPAAEPEEGTGGAPGGVVRVLPLPSERALPLQTRVFHTLQTPAGALPTSQATHYPENLLPACPAVPAAALRELPLSRKPCSQTPTQLHLLSLRLLPTPVQTAPSTLCPSSSDRAAVLFAHLTVKQLLISMTPPRCLPAATWPQVCGFGLALNCHLQTHH